MAGLAILALCFGKIGFAMWWDRKLQAEHLARLAKWFG